MAVRKSGAIASGINVRNKDTFQETISFVVLAMYLVALVVKETSKARRNTIRFKRTFLTLIA